MYPQVFGKYVLERELSRGGMARVVLATLRGAGGFEKRLVVKQIRDELAFDQQFVRRFVEEAKTTVALSHPNIVPVYELGVEQGTYFLAMELVEGVSIAELVRERDAAGSKRVLTPEEGAYVGMEVCRALDYAHRRMKVVHRDITPRNVMLDEEGQVKLIDFGIAAPARVAGHEILGSPGHMPPEQVDGHELGPPTDIFAVAVLLMEAWSGTPPFRRATPEGCDAAMRAPHPKPSDADPRLAPLDEPIGRAMRLDPGERQQQAGDLGRALRKFLSGVDVTDVGHSLGERVRSLRQRQEDEAAGPASLEQPKPLQPSQAEFGTRTFAAREEGAAWTPASAGDGRPSAPDLEPITPDQPFTRKLMESVPPPLHADTPRATPKAPDLSIPTPLMVQTGITPEAALEAARAAKERAAATSKTPPIEVPPRPKFSEGEKTRRRIKVARPEQPNDPFRAWLRPAVVVAALAGGFFAWRMQNAFFEGPRAGEVKPATVTSAVPVLPVVTPSAEARPPASAAPPATASAPTASGAPPVPVVPVSASAPTSPGTLGSAAMVAGRAQATLLGDPGTRVSVDGASRGACPVRLALEPGAHDIRFVFEPTGESRGERLTVKAGERVTVRADFTGATPTVRVQR